MSNQVDIDNVTIDSVSELRLEVKELIGNPISVWAVAAIIESLGVREVDAHNEFGYDSIFDLARDIYTDLKKEYSEQHAAESNIEDNDFNLFGAWNTVKQFLKYYCQGLLFSLPMISQIAAIIIFRYSLWAWLEFNEAQATVIAFGTIVAFIITGGFVQVLGRDISSYMSNNNYYLAFEATKKTVKKGVLVIIGTVVFFYLLNIIFPFYPPRMLALGLMYMVLISFLLLASAILYALKRRVSILVIILAGTSMVIFNMDVLGLGIYISQWLAILTTTALLAGYGIFYFKFQIRSQRQDLLEQSLPNPEVRYYTNYRYFIYGLSYFLFLFLDRILAWSAGELPPPYIIWFNTPYELGMDWALITLVLSIAVLEYSVHAFSEALLPLQEKTSFSQLEKINTYFNRLYSRHLLLLTGVGVISIFLTYYSVKSLIVFQDSVPEVRDFFMNIMTEKVFWIASISYLFLNIGLFHSLFFFTLSKPAYAMYSILSGLMVNLFIGYMCSRILGLEYATLGLLAGAVVFAVVSGVIAQRFFKRLDYFYYSAF